MQVLQGQLVDLVRDFLNAYYRMRRAIEGFHAGELRFAEVERLVSDGEASLLFRLKERSHALFRAGDGGAAMAVQRAALFDLAVGSLFHEAMKLRENLYQREIYAPKIQELRGAAPEEAQELFLEFDKILEAAAVRLDEAVAETERLLELTRTQFRQLLLDYREHPLLARTLFVNRSAVEGVFSEGLDSLLAYIFDDAVEGYASAARSYLESAYFDEAIDALAEAEQRCDGRADLEQLARYAEGMQAFMAGEYGHCLQHLEAWIDAGVGPDEKTRASLAMAALSRVEHLVDPAERASVAGSAARLVAVLAPISGQG